MKLTRLAPVLLAASMLCPPALAQMDSREGIALQNQIAELRQELQSVQQAQQGGAGPPPYASPPPGYPTQVAPGDTAAELVVRVSTLEEQNRHLQGRVDDLTNQLQRQHDELSKQIGDLAFKLGQDGTTAASAAPEGRATAGRMLTPDQPISRPKPAVRRTPELALREGNAALARRDYPGAAAAARETLNAAHGTTAVSAQFLLARAEAGQHQYKEAAADFYQAYNHAPKSGTAPVALLGVANTLIAMNDPHDACQALAKLAAEFPNAAGLRPSVSSARKRAACSR